MYKKRPKLASLGLLFPRRQHLSGKEKIQNITLYKVIILAMATSTLNAAVFCTKVDCYNIPDDVVEKKVQDCLYQAQMNMLILRWKQDNNWKQVEWIGGNKVLQCVPYIPNNFKTGQETQEQLKFLEELRCRLHNMKRDPVRYQIYYYELCMQTFKTEQYR